MNTADVSYHVLDRPFPDDFIAWYPYIRPEVMRRNRHWLPCMREVLLDGAEGVRDRMVAAHDERSGQWLGVVWLQVPGPCPELAHFGWFLVEQRCRGAGVGAGIIRRCIDTLEAEGVRMIMLPTELSNERAIGMYWRRGWRLAIVSPDGGVWMVREPENMWQEYFTPASGKPIDASAPRASDGVALDYLLARPASAIRLLPLGLTGTRRFVSFTHDWRGGEHAVARQGGRPLALAVAAPGQEGAMVDVYGLHREPMAAALTDLLARVERPFAEIAAGDAVRRAAVEDAGLRAGDELERSVAGAAMTVVRYAE